MRRATMSVTSRGGLLAVVAAEPEEVPEATQRRHLAGVDAVRVDHDAGLARPAGRWSAVPPRRRSGEGGRRAPGRDRPRAAGRRPRPGPGGRRGRPPAGGGGPAPCRSSTSRRRSAGPQSSGRVVAVEGPALGGERQQAVDGAASAPVSLGQALGRAAGGCGRSTRWPLRVRILTSRRAPRTSSRCRGRR